LKATALGALSNPAQRRAAVREMKLSDVLLSVRAKDFKGAGRQIANAIAEIAAATDKTSLPPTSAARRGAS
jgi:hypothetical protein